MKTCMAIVAIICLPFLSLVAQANVGDSLLHQNIQRKYIIHIPPSYTGDSPTPLVITLHGGSGTNQNAQGFTQMNFASNDNGFLVAYPQGAGVAPPGFSWADGRGTSADNAGIDDVGFISKMINAISEDYNLDPNRVYVCGFSNGGFMTQRLACELSDRFAAVGGLGCSMDTSLFATCSPSSPIPMAYFAGTADPEVPFNGGPMNNPNVLPIVPVDSAVQFWVRHNNCQTVVPKIDLPDLVTDDNSTAQLFDFTDCDCNTSVRFFKLIGAGHTWPGVEILNIEPLLGETNEDIHASYQLWNFFSMHSNCDELTSTEYEELATIDAQVFPNPSKGIITIKSSEQMYTISLVNAFGQAIFRNKIMAKEKSFSLADLPPGVYFIQIEVANNQSVIRKLILQ
ncbi:MAG: PHB depolymerase family esterase [Bacteroidota bacterium]